MPSPTLSPSLLALLLYAGWTLALLLMIAALRTTLVMQRKRKINAFAPSGDDVSPFSGRLCRAHANCVENLPIVGAVIVVAHLTHQTSVTDPLALWLVAARIGQSTAHLVSLRRRVILVRFGFFAAQVLIVASWVVQLLVGWLR